MKVSQFYPHDINIDGEIVKFRIKRMTVDEHIEFSNRARASGEPTYIRFISREPDGPEQERNEKGDYKIPLEQLADRKVSELPPDKRAEFEAELAKDEKKAQDFLKYVFSNFVTVAAGLLEELGDGAEQTVSEGIDVLRLFGARNDVLSRLVEAVRIENEMPEAKKKIWRSAYDFTASLSEHGPDPDGPKPETIAPLVGIEDCAEIGDVGREKESEPSGSTEILSSNVAPS